MHSICIFCGSRRGRSPAPVEAAARIGRHLGQQGRRLVFGGGQVGLMGVTADAALAAGGEVIGVIPRHLMRREVAHQGLSSLEVVEDMLTRKARMIELADGLLTLPGGLGSLDELLEVMTWTQLGELDCPLALFNQEGYYDPLLAQFDRAVEAGFMDAEHRDMIEVLTSLDQVIDWLDGDARPLASGEG